MCIEVISLPATSRIENVFYQVLGLVQFDVERERLRRNIITFLVRHMDREFDLIPHMFANSLLIKDRKSCEEELQKNVNVRMNLIANNEKNKMHFSISS